MCVFSLRSDALLQVVLDLCNLALSLDLAGGGDKGGEGRGWLNEEWRLGSLAVKDEEQ